MEPTDVGPAVGGHLKASDGDREKVITLLDAAYADGRLTRDEHGERVQAALQAAVFDDLVPLTRDLVALDGRAKVAVSAPAAGPLVDPSGSTGDLDSFVAIFGGTTRKGAWRVRSRMDALAVFGGVDLNMREAVFDAPVTEIRVFCMFGGVDIKVPEGVYVRDEVAGIFGGSEVSGTTEESQAPVKLIVKGVALFGGVECKGPKRKRWWKGQDR